MAVCVVDRRKHPLMPCSEKRARLLLARERAVVHRLAPFTIRLKDRLAEASAIQPVVLKVDPGSRTTGLALAREEPRRRGPSITRCICSTWPTGARSACVPGDVRPIAGDAAAPTCAIARPAFSTGAEGGLAATLDLEPGRQCLHLGAAVSALGPAESHRGRARPL